ncbi:Phosphoribosylglycinamide formyltransferase [hydrothermal vent metagenome]|uniref:phosphoribosylglycinamide formyltransferase 1 n=1 Tax=hydrothermal vent metagenome TaxID=652676 RepID=A0A3B0Z8E2_9ZZZZ
MSDKKLVILISGNGSNLQAIIDSVTESYIQADIAAVISNRGDAYGLIRAQLNDIPTHTIEHTQYTKRTEFDKALQICIDQYQPDLLILAGFLRILSADFVQHYHAKILNIHPSLLPKYPGLNTHQQALDAGDTSHGTTVHFVTPELDSGPLVIQASQEITSAHRASNEPALQLASEILEQEHIIYPLAIKWFIEDRLKLSQNGAELDGELLRVPKQLQTIQSEDKPH